MNRYATHLCRLFSLLEYFSQFFSKHLLHSRATCRPRVRRIEGPKEEAELSQAHALELACWTQPALCLAGLSVSSKIFISPSSQLPGRRRTKSHACSVIIPQHLPECHILLWVSAFVSGLSSSQWLKAITSTIPLLLGSCHTELCVIPTHLEHICVASQVSSRSRPHWLGQMTVFCECSLPVPLTSGLSLLSSWATL